ncbi:MAG: hypothetical protein H8D45_11020 [Bacteroidetes bacterium]|nr:hypothetical protein [Bacteroidota bacterium]
MENDRVEKGKRCLEDVIREAVELINNSGEITEYAGYPINNGQVILHFHNGKVVKAEKGKICFSVEKD